MRLLFLIQMNLLEHLKGMCNISLALKRQFMPSLGIINFILSVF